MARTIGGTSGKEKSLFCNYCKRDTLHVSNMERTHGIIVGLAITIMTCGLALPVILMVLAFSEPDKFVCQFCGKHST